jgi:hypothetical protein
MLPWVRCVAPLPCCALLICVMCLHTKAVEILHVLCFSAMFAQQTGGTLSVVCGCELVLVMWVTAFLL